MSEASADKPSAKMLLFKVVWFLVVCNTSFLYSASSSSFFAIWFALELAVSAAATHIESKRVAIISALPKIPCSSSEFSVLSKSIINISGIKGGVLKHKSEFLLGLGYP